MHVSTRQHRLEIGGRRSKLLDVLMTRDVQEKILALNDMARWGLFSGEIDEVLSEGNPAGKKEEDTPREREV